MNRIEELLSQYKYFSKRSHSALKAEKKADYVYCQNELVFITRQLWNAGINQAQIDRLVNA